MFTFPLNPLKRYRSDLSDLRKETIHVVRKITMRAQKIRGLKFHTL